MSPFLFDNRFGLRATHLAVLLLLQSFFASQVIGADLQTAISEAQSAANAGDYSQAFTTGIAALENHVESAWDQRTLVQFLLDISDKWFVKLTTGQKQTALAGMDSVQSPGAKLTRAYAKWKLGQRSQALSEWMTLINQHPDSVGAYWAIYAYFLGQWESFSDNNGLCAEAFDWSLTKTAGAPTITVIPSAGQTPTLAAAPNGFDGGWDHLPLTLDIDSGSALGQATLRLDVRARGESQVLCSYDATITVQ